MLPTSRDELKTYCLHKLGSPIINIEITDDQMDDRIDEGLQYFWDYHYDGAEKVYYAHKVTDEDIQNRYLQVPENIIGVVSIFNIGDPSIHVNDLFDIRYQIALNDLYTLTSVSVVPYYCAMTHLEVLEEILVGQQPIRFNRHTGRVYLDCDWNYVTKDMFIIIESYMKIDPDEFTSTWHDRWLLDYVPQLFKKQWGSNIGKYRQVEMLGGTILNGDAIYNQADNEIENLRRRMINDYSTPCLMFMN